MKIEWKITKKRGNWRPVLEYTCIKEDWEIELCIPGGGIESSIPIPPKVGYATITKHCFDAQYENRPDRRLEYYKLSFPQKDEKQYSEQFILPWRPDTNSGYPEVEESMLMLREEYEKRIKEAYDSGPFEVTGSLGMSEGTKRHVAPGVAAQRMLKVVNE